MLARDTELSEDLYDIALIEKRKNESEVPFEEILKEHNVKVF